MLTFIYTFLLSLLPLNEDVVLHDLNVKIDGLKKEEGVILVAVFNKEENFLDEEKSFTYRKIVPTVPVTEFVIQDLPEGKYAVTVFHDVNMDEELNCYLLGIPKEPFGFSNNPKIISGRPDFENTSFDLMESKDITIKLKKL